MDAFNFNDLLNSLTTEKDTYLPDDLEPVPFQERFLGFSFLNEMGEQHELVKGLHKGVEVVKVRYGSKNSPQVLYVSDDGYCLFLYAGRDPVTNNILFSKVTGSLIPISFVEPIKVKSVKSARHVKHHVKRSPVSIKPVIVKKPRNNPAERAKRRQERIMKEVSPDDLAGLLGAFKITPSERKTSRMQEFGKSRKVFSIRSIKSDIRLLKLI